MATLIKSIYLSRDDYGTDKGKLKGTVTFSSQSGEVTVKIPADKSAKLVMLLADELVECAKTTAALMVTDVITDADLALLS